MDQLTLGIVTLLRSALNHEMLSLPTGFDLEQALPVLRQHSLSGMAIRGAMRCGVPKTDPAFQQLVAVFRQEVLRSGRQMQRLRELTELFRANGIDFLFVKGAVMKPLYPQPELRVMGDADILIRAEQDTEVHRVLSSGGWKFDGDIDYECQWSCDGVSVDIHRCLSAPQDKLYYAYYQNSWRLAVKADSDSGPTYCLRPEDQFLFLLTHFVRHYRGGAVPVKSICDFYVFRRAHPDMDESYLAEELQKLHLQDFYRHILRLIDCWFCGAEWTEAVRRITDTAFQGGIYDWTESQVISSAIRETKQDASMLGKKVKWVLWRLFPPADYLHTKFPVLKRFQVLLPVFWVVRFWEIITHPQRRDFAVKTSKLMIRAEESRLTHYQEQLRAVGLDISDRE